MMLDRNLHLTAKGFSSFVYFAGDHCGVWPSEAPQRGNGDGEQRLGWEQ